MSVRPSAAERLSRVVAWALPFGLAAVRCSPFAQWRGDGAALRDIALVPMGLGGGVSTVLSQVAAYAPLGSKTFRTSVVAAVALGIAGKALYSIALRMLRALQPADAPSRFTAPLLAALASLTATMTPLYQEEATVGGGAVVAVALALGAIALAFSAFTDRDTDRPMARIVGAAFLAGAAAAERPWVGAAAGLALVVGLVLLRAIPGVPRVFVPWRVFGKALGASITGALVFALPSVLRGIAPKSALALGGVWRAAPPPIPALDDTPRFVDAFTDQIGFIPLGLAVFGSILLVAKPSGRLLALVPLSVVGLDIVVRASLGSTPGTIGVRLLAIGGLACASTAGLFAGAGMLVRFRVPFARPSAALLVAFHATLVALITETASARADRVAQRGADGLTDVGLDGLPPSSALLVGSPHWVWRLTVAQMIEGRRPDVLVLPRSLVARGRVAIELLAREPVTEPLFRTLALTGTSDEASLAALSDKRPLFLELDRGWTERVTSHLSLDGAWLRFRTDPPSKTDRRARADVALAAVGAEFPPAEIALLDTDTRFVLGSALRAQAKVLLRQGDAETAGRALLCAGGSATEHATTEGGSYDILFASAVARLPVVKHMNDRKVDRTSAAPQKPRQR